MAIPALLFSSIVPGISFELLGYAWPLLLLPAVYLLLGLAIGGLMLVLVQPPSNCRLSTVAACTFGNTTGIPVVLLSVLQQSLSRSVFADIADPLLFLSIELLTFPLLQVREPLQQHPAAFHPTRVLACAAVAGRAGAASLRAGR